MQSLTILAPVSGPLVPIDTVPDPVFAGRVVGDGVAIDPIEPLVVAPADGVVIQLHRARHAFTLRTDDGIEVLVHVGIDTVQLGGEGFEPLVAQGERVRAGQALLRFDADAVGLRARSLLTVVLVTTPERVARLRVAPGPVRAGAPLLHVGLAEIGAATLADAGDFVLSRPVALPNAAGLHARPAAVFSQSARAHAGDVRLVHGASEANAKSVTALLLLSLRKGDVVQVRVQGEGAEALAASLALLLEQGCGEAEHDAPVAAGGAVATPAVPTGATPSGADLPGLRGVCASPGIGLGRVHLLREVEIHVEERGQGQVEEAARLHAALAHAQQEISVLQDAAGKAERRQILQAHVEVLADPDLQQSAQEGIARGHSAGHAWREAYLGLAGQLQRLDNALLRERANDVRDVGRRVLARLGTPVGGAAAARDFAPDSVLVAEELAPSVIATLERGALAGICTTGGGPTSHVAILARSLGIPALCGADPQVLALEDGVPVLIDADRGCLVPDPDSTLVARANALMLERAEQDRADRSRMHDPAHTRDGMLIEVAANVASPADARAAAQNGADGVGLLRSEFLFGDRPDEPGPEEQRASYRGVADAFSAGARVIVRTLDVGGDKPLAYLPMPAEENPFLGVRGLRVSLEHPDLFDRQLRAILEGGGTSDLHVMFPMVASLEELRRARAALDRAQQATGRRARVGIMIEVPAAALIAAEFAPEVDFFSIGTNDLTQYTLAMDRGHPRLAAQADALHPAVLRLIGMTCDAARAHGKWVGVCGGLAAEPLAVPALVGLGVTELSVPPASVPTIKARVRSLDAGQCRALAAELLVLGTAARVRERLAAPDA